MHALPNSDIKDSPRGRVLLVEDCEIIALDTEDMLRDLGFEVVLARSSEQALRVLEDHVIDCAVLDINLGSETSFPVAHLLAGRAIPFIFAKGYGARPPVDGLAASRMVTKPYTPDMLAAAIFHVMGAARTSPPAA